MLFNDRERENYLSLFATNSRGVIYLLRLVSTAVLRKVRYYITRGLGIIGVSIANRLSGQGLGFTADNPGN